MSALEWLILLTVQSLVLGVVLLAWFDLSQKLTLRPTGLGLSSGQTDALPESFLVTEGEAARVEATLREESQRRSQTVGRSERNWSIVR